LAAFWPERISLKSHGTRIKTEMQPAGDDVALRTHGDVLDRSVDIASSAFQSAAFEDRARAGFRSQDLHDARGTFRGVCAGDPKICTGSHKPVSVVVKSSKQFGRGFLEECACGADNRVCSANCRMHHFAILQLDRRAKSDPFMGGGFCERRHGAACDAQRGARNRP